jgi:hypothetical protein
MKGMTNDKLTRSALWVFTIGLAFWLHSISVYYFPSFLRGYSFSMMAYYIFVLIQTIMLAFLCVKFNLVKIKQKWQLTLYIGVFSGGLFVFHFMQTFVLNTSVSVIFQDECIPSTQEFPFEKMERCSGESTQGWMNSEKYHFQSWGIARKELCLPILEFSGKREEQPLPVGSHCSLANAKYWKETSCPDGSKFGKCFYCARTLSNGNNVFYQGWAVSENCQESLFVMSSDIGPRDPSILFR